MSTAATFIVGRAGNYFLARNGTRIVTRGTYLTPGRFLTLAPDAREVLLPADYRGILLAPDVRTILVNTEGDMTAPIQSWSPAAGADVDFYWLSLSRWIPTGDTVNNPSVAILGPAGDATPLTVSNVLIDTGARQVIIPPGVPFNDPGPRVQMKMTGGTVGVTYTTVITWQDTQGRTINRQAQLLVEW